MRTIEFRAWDNKNKKMFDSDWKGEAYGTGEIFLSQDGKVFELSSNYACEADDEGSMTDKLEAREWVAMQFTGLLDRHGKKIFEGDVIYSDQWTPTTYQVAFDQGAFYIAGADLHECADIKYAEKFEVIGNIYENGDLLK